MCLQKQNAHTPTVQAHISGQLVRYYCAIPTLTDAAVSQDFTVSQSSLKDVCIPLYELCDLNIQYVAAK